MHYIIINGQGKGKLRKQKIPEGWAVHSVAGDREGRLCSGVRGQEGGGEEKVCGETDLISDGEPEAAVADSFGDQCTDTYKASEYRMFN